MKNIAKSAATARFSPRACLAALGLKLRALDLLKPIRERWTECVSLTLLIRLESVRNSLFQIS